MNAKIFASFVTLVGVGLLAIGGAVAQDLPLPTTPPPTEAAKASETVDLTACVESGLLIARTEFQRLWEANTWQNWAALLISLALAILAGWIVTAVLGWLGRRLQARGWRTRRYLFVSLIGPSKLILLTLGLQFGLASLNLKMTPPLALEDFFSKLVLLLYSIAVIWYASNLTQLIEVVLRRLAGRTESPLDQQLAPFAAKTLQWVLLVFGALYVAKTVFGQDIGAWLAGLGIAGLAVSLAAQDSLKNLFGSITILLDRPFRVGQRIVYAGYDGTVEQIGFRSTRLRTLTGNLVNIPNSKIVNDPIENIGMRPAIQRVINVTITYDTPQKKIQQAVSILREILEEPGIGELIHPIIDGTPFPPRVFFNEFNADSLNLFVIYWYAPPSWWDYMAHAERLNFRILEEFEKAEIEFAFPTRTLYLADDPKRRLRIESRQ